MVLGLDDWLLDTKGNASLYTFAYLRSFATHAGRVVLDSPRFPQDQDPAAALQSMDYAWQQFSAACAANSACHATLPDPTAALRTAVQRLDASPLVVSVASGRLADHAARPVRIRVDGGKLLRVVRATLGGDGPANLGQPADDGRGRVEAARRISSWSRSWATTRRPAPGVGPSASIRALSSGGLPERDVPGRRPVRDGGRSQLPASTGPR